jgi:hypothetical protein
MREFVAMTDAKSRTARLLKTVANELQRLGVRWTAPDDEGTAYAELLDSMTVSPADSDYEAMRLDSPRGVRGCLLVHRAVLES